MSLKAGVELRRQHADVKTKPALLVISPYLPYPPNQGGRLLIYNKLAGLADRFDLFLVAVSSLPEPEAESARTALQKLCREVHYCRPDKTASVSPLRSTLEALLRAYLWRRPAMVEWMRSRSLTETVQRLLHTHAIDVVNFESLYLLEVCGGVRWGGTKLVASEHNIEHDVLLQQAEQSKVWIKKRLLRREAEKLAQAEKALARRVSRIIFISDTDLRLAQQLGWESDLCLADLPFAPPDTVKPFKTAHLPARNRAIFTSNLGHFANQDALLWFYREVMPLVVKACPGFGLVATGEPTEKIRAAVAGDAAVELTGMLSAAGLQQAILESELFLSPLRFGGGIKLKVIEAMGYGMPMVMTSKSAEGVRLEHRRDALIADTPAEFARAVIEAMTDRDLRARLAQNARRTFDERYSADVAIEKWNRLYSPQSFGSQHVGASIAAATPPDAASEKANVEEPMKKDGA